MNYKIKLRKTSMVGGVSWRLNPVERAESK